jgi:mono/diheme cytochrome c family protein
MILQQEGGHPGQLSDDELKLVRQWIADGALAEAAPEAEAPTPEAEAPTPEEGVTWDGDLADLMQQKCAACHSAANALGGLDLSSYDAAMVGGNSGPAIQPSDPAASVLLTVQAGGGHPAQLSEEELALITEWVEAGAPQN